MNDEKKEIFEHLKHAYYKLRANWELYIELYGTNPERIKLLNSAAPYVFGHIQNIFLDHILLGIARLTDSAQTGKNKNLSIQTLTDLKGCQDFEEQFNTALNNALQSSKFCRELRNKVLAHNDLAKIQDATIMLEEVTRVKIKEGIESIYQMLNIVSESFFDTTIGDKITQRPIGGAYDLLSCIDDGVSVRLAKEIRIKSGKISPDDWKKKTREWE